MTYGTPSNNTLLNTVDERNFKKKKKDTILNENTALAPNTHTPMAPPAISRLRMAAAVRDDKNSFDNDF